ncbi:MAG: FAD-binding oxidoreductase [Candidatus Bathyarchaeia archaeon]
MEKLEKRHHPLYESLCAVVGSRYVADEDFAVYAYSRDSSVFPARVPGIIVRPGSTEEVSDIVKIANRANFPVIPIGGKAGIFGITKGEPKRSIVIDLTRMNKLVDINEENMTITVECGLTYSRLHTSLKERKVYTPFVWIPGYPGTIGGVISHGGILRWGEHYSGIGNSRNVLSLEVVLPTGEVIQTGSAANKYAKVFCRYTHGPDLTSLFIGDHGIFGVKTKATLKLLHWPIAEWKTCAFDSEEKALKAHIELSKLPHDGVPTNAALIPPWNAAMVLLGEEKWNMFYEILAPDEEEFHIRAKRAENITKKFDARPASESFREFVKSPGFEWPINSIIATYGMHLFSDIIFPRDMAVENYRIINDTFFRKYEEDLKKYQIQRWDVFSFGDDCIIYCPYMFFDDSDEQARKRALEIFKELLSLLIELGGITYFLDQDWGNIAAEAFPPDYKYFLRTLKRAIDPYNILQPTMFAL